MKITICGSMQFAEQMLKIKNELQKLEFEVITPLTTDECAKRPNDNLNEDYEFCIANNVTKDHFDKIENSDAILVVNYPKNNISGYIGGATLQEMSIAYHFNKKIFVLHDLPSENEIRYAFEIKIMRPIILNGNIKNIKNHL
ncbi:MAG: hypothetical protein GF365_04880 [Candidatus Buchananbacteria bacterium]|nr:hypothetical protein [Candidatus Buchananbacteria bacterium]